MKYLFLLLGIAALQSCVRGNNELGKVQGLSPVYLDRATAEIITQQAPQPIVNGGKIATLGNYIYQVEEGEGIHIINNSNPANPQKVSYLKIPYCQEVTFKGNFLYTNNVSDLVVLDVSNINNITVSTRIKDAFPKLIVQYPAETNVYFECADPAKGLVVKWETKELLNPKCRR